jgi:hypothetical protein
MKKLLFNLTFQINPDADAATTVDAIEAINDELARRGYSANANVTAARSSPAPKQVQGPLEKHWCAERDVRGVRRTDGRTSEQQAEYNLRHYLDYKDEEIQEILANAPPVSISTEKISEQLGVVQDSEDDEDEASLM